MVELPRSHGRYSPLTTKLQYIFERDHLSPVARHSKLYQQIFFALRHVVAIFPIHTDTLVSPKRWQDCGGSPWPCESPLSRAWHCLEEGGLTSAPAWRKACLQLCRLDDSMPVLKALFVF